LARGVHEGGLCKLLVDPVALVYSNKKLDEPPRFSKAYEEWQDAMTKEYNSPTD